MQLLRDHQHVAQPSAAQATRMKRTRVRETVMKTLRADEEIYRGGGGSFYGVRRLPELEHRSRASRPVMKNTIPMPLAFSFSYPFTRKSSKNESEDRNGMTRV